MKKHLLVLALAIACAGTQCFAQDTTVTVQDTIVSVNEPVNTEVATPIPGDQDIYKMKWGIDIPLTVVTCGVTLYNFSKIYSKDRLTMDELNSLNPNNVNAFDRAATRQFDEKFGKIGDYIFYGSMPLPLLFLADKKIRNDYFKVMTLYLESMGITGILYSSAVHFDRYRPYAYNPEAPTEFRMRGGARNSFFAGHPALVGTSTFFMATIYSHYHPEFKAKWLLYTLAGAATATTALARYKSGRHFPSDILIGITLGPLSGILIPHIHKNKDLSKRSTTVLPFFGQSSGLAVVHKF
jgi:membrane-associated phospholipid phosphatase